MSRSVTLGGNRIGSGNKMKIGMHGYERSSHDLSYAWRNTQAPGTLVPFLSQIALPGDTFDIDLDGYVNTHPTVGPLFGSYKLQLDVFQVPIRLYQAQLHMNEINIGNDMSNVGLPKMVLEANTPDIYIDLNNQQVNPSCIFKYLGISGLGVLATGEQSEPLTRTFNAIPWLGYWDIYKQYYANKQEGIGAVIHKSADPYAITMTAAVTKITDPNNVTIQVGRGTPTTAHELELNDYSRIEITAIGLNSEFDSTRIQMWTGLDTSNPVIVPSTYAWGQVDVYIDLGKIILSKPIIPLLAIQQLYYNQDNVNYDGLEPVVLTFDLANIDQMRKNILKDVENNDGYLITYDESSGAPYSSTLERGGDSLGYRNLSIRYSQEGLGLKTYQSDLFNNWINTEWIDGSNGINAVTAIDTTGDSFTINDLMINRKIYDMLMRIAVSDGTYDAWLGSVYDHDRVRSIENPMYEGGLIKEIVFQEVISTVANEDQPLGTLGGRGRMGSKNRGGKVIVKVNEPSYIIGIVSITPHIDYCQGNKWDMTQLKTMNDLHKPALDEIGFQDLITDQMAWWDTTIDSGGITTYKSAGKQPAYINYMTEVNRVYGNFAIKGNEQFMVLVRDYEAEIIDANTISIKDLTTYIDPVKFNQVFAVTRRDQMNFWVNLQVGIHARRKMSAKLMPNL
jgi:hypothetical protein